MRLSHDIQSYMRANQQSKHTEYLTLLRRHLAGCSSFVLMKDQGGNDFEYITAHMCKDKLCAICNAERKRIVRNKYIVWFRQNPVLYRYLGKLYTRRTLPAGATDYYAVKYDLMHLTLTVPHTVNGYKGRQIYYRQLIEDFNRMRKMADWQNWIYGGEYGVEATSNDSGLHIHIHALCFVRQAKQNRNIVHRIVLGLWNHITIDCNNSRSEFSREVIFSIKKSNALLTDEDINALSPKGATLIGLENIYVKSDNGEKLYAADSDRARIKAVLETVSYHFKPKMFELEDGSFDVATIAKVYAATRGMILYRKFGVLHKETCLNIKDTTLLEELNEAKETEEAVSGNTYQSAACGYFFSHPFNMYVDGGGIHIKDTHMIADVEANTTKEALKQMELYIRKNHIFN